jgi:hypothetical protein
MSEVKTNETVKQEGEFKIKKKTPKKLTETKDNITKVNVNPKEPLIQLEDNVTKVEIKKEDDAIQIGETEKATRWKNLYQSPTRLLKGFLRSRK